MADFAEKLKAARKDAGLSQIALSNWTGIPRRTIENWERGLCQPSRWVERLVLREVVEVQKAKKNGMTREEYVQAE